MLPAVSPSSGSPDRAERTFALHFALVVMTLTTLPYLLGFASQGQGWRFSGFLFGVEDGNSYIAKMLCGAAGAWLFRTPYTAYPQHGTLAYLPYLLLGKLTAPPGWHEQLVALYHLYRFAAGVLAILATHDFLAYFVPQREWRRWGLVLAVLGGGLGWLVVLFGGPAPGWQNVPLEFYSPESFGFLALYGLPHLAAARALLLWGLLAFLEKRPRRAGALWLLMGFFQPLTVPVAWGVLGAALAAGFLLDFRRARQGGRFPRRETQAVWRRFALTVGLSSPLALYTAWAFGHDPFLRAWAMQNVIASPPPLQYLLAYGLMLAFALTYALHRPQRAALLPGVWLLLFPLLAYAPYNLQRRMPEGVWVALVTLALLGGQRLLSLPRFRLLTALALPSTFLLLAGGALSAVRPAPPVFLPAQQAALYEDLQGLSRPGDVVLSSFASGNALPAWAPVHVVIGHGPESARLEALRPRVAAFYAAETPDAERRALLEELGVRWVLWGPQERALGDADLYRMPYLRPAAARGPYVLFQAAP